MGALGQPIREAVGGLMPSALSTREAAAVLRVSETTLRRALREARDAATPGATEVRGSCRATAFTALRVPRGNAYAWRFVLRSGTPLAPVAQAEPEKARVIPFPGVTLKRLWRWRFWR